MTLLIAVLLSPKLWCYLWFIGFVKTTRYVEQRAKGNMSVGNYLEILLEWPYFAVLFLRKRFRKETKT